MKANPGGLIPISDILGRDEFIKNLWRILGRQSVVLVAERRIGKTCIIRKMVAEPPSDRLPIYHDLESTRTVLQFVELVLHDVECHLSRFQRTTNKAYEFLSKISGTELKDVKLPENLAPHWKMLLTKTIEDLIEKQQCPAVFFWDEMPLMLYNIKQFSNEKAAMELLDTLRELRHTFPGIRMVYTGSVGLHGVLTSLKKRGYANDPTNDMKTVEVPPLSDLDAQQLAMLLLEGEGICTNDQRETAKAIALSTEGFPYYIHCIVDDMVLRGRTAGGYLPEEIVNERLKDPEDPWHMRYCRERIDVYYDSLELPFALGLLDILSTASSPVKFDELLDLLKSKMKTEDAEMMRSVLERLKRDHYIAQDSNGAYHFRFSLVKRFWQLHRGLL